MRFGHSGFGSKRCVCKGLVGVKHAVPGSPQHVDLPPPSVGIIHKAVGTNHDMVLVRS